MQTPLCSICIESDDILCNGCRAKLEDGDISQEAVELSRLLSGLSSDIETLQDVEIKQVIPTSHAVVVLTAEGDGPKVVGRGGRVVKQIAELFERSIRVVEDTGEVDKVVEKLLAPVEHQGVRTVYRPEGEEEKVIVSTDDEPRVPFTTEEFQEMVEQLTDERVLLSFE